MLRVALAQINTTVGDLAGNREKILDFTRRARERQADLVVFPELAITGYPPEDLLFKDHFVRDSLKSLRQLAREVKDVVVVVGCVDSGPGTLYNAAAVLADGKIQGMYHKRDLPNYGVFDEKRYFSTGRSASLLRLGDVLIGVSVCEDIWTEDGVYRQQIKAGADVLLNISCSPYEFEKLEIRHRLLTRRARESGAFVCYANLVGGQDELVFDGGSLVASPGGKILACGRQFEEDLVVVDLPVPARSKRKTSVPLLARLPLAGSSARAALPAASLVKPSRLERMYQALVTGTRDYVRKNGFNKVVIGLSGGIDSAVVAVIAVQAIGKDNVVGMTMPSRFSSEGTRSDARTLAGNLGIQFLDIPIEGIYGEYLKTLAGPFAGHKPGVAEENLQARIRGNLLMAFSNKFGWLVLTTGNKSEFAVGYCTLYGDMSGGFAVIKDVPKTRIFDLARLMNEQHNGIIPQSVIERPPSAELRENQKDEDSLPPYAVLDPLLTAYVEEHHSLSELARKSTPQTAREVIRLVDGSEYKRRQSPPGIKITPRAFGKDWRLPITNKYKEI